MLACSTTMFRRRMFSSFCVLGLLLLLCQFCDARNSTGQVQKSGKGVNQTSDVDGLDQRSLDSKMHVDQNKDDGKEVHQDEEKPPENKEGQGGEGDNGNKAGEGDNGQNAVDGGTEQKEGGNGTNQEGGR
ncbi:unnamed protein product [Meloidogyne enterolobii]|uniref:Uncharacterized protein n=1 Tax=Meloidogyne enterolobii TaxID=390850 RepID=A0ACB0YQG5_MELEN